MNDPLERLFRHLATSDPGDAASDADCPSADALADLIARASGETESGVSPVEPALLRHVARCAVCADTVRVLVSLDDDASATDTGREAPAHPATGTTPPATTPTTPVIDAARFGVGRWLIAAAALLVVGLVVVLVARSIDRTGPERLSDDVVVVAAAGGARVESRVISAGDRLAKGAAIVVPEGASLTVIDGAGRVRVLGRAKEGLSDRTAYEDATVRELVATLGESGTARRDRVLALPHTPRSRPSIDAKWPRSGIRELRPTFRFAAPNIEPGEELILVVRSEEGDRVLERRTKGGATEVRYPAGAPPLVRGESYVWSLFHPRSGPGQLGGESFRVVAADAVEQATAAAARFESLEGTCPRWLIDLLKAAKYRALGLDSEADAILPSAVPADTATGRAFRRFALEERALLYHALGQDERIGAVQAELRALR